MKTKPKPDWLRQFDGPAGDWLQDHIDSGLFDKPNEMKTKPLFVRALFYTKSNPKPAITMLINWDDREQVRQFAYQADHWLRTQPGGSVTTTTNGENCGCDCPHHD